VCQGVLRFRRHRPNDWPFHLAKQGDIIVA